MLYRGKLRFIIHEKLFSVSRAMEHRVAILLPAASAARVVLPGLQDATTMSFDQSMSKTFYGSRMESPRTPRSPRTLRGRLKTARMRAEEASRLLSSILRGHMSAHDFARTIAAAAPDLEWLEALGSALGDLGTLVESANSSALEQQMAQTAEAYETAQQLQDALEASYQESMRLRGLLEKAGKDLQRLKSEVEFLSMFSGPRPRRAAEAHADEAPDGPLLPRWTAAPAAPAVPTAPTAPTVPTARGSAAERAERIARQEAMLKKHQKEHAEELDRIDRTHAEALRKLHAQLAEEKHQHAAAFDAREEIFSSQRRADEQKLKKAEAEAEAAALREGLYRAQAAAAAAVLTETQAELQTARNECQRLRIQLEQGRGSVASANAAFEGLVSANASLVRDVALARAQAAATVHQGATPPHVRGTTPIAIVTLVPEPPPTRLGGGMLAKPAPPEPTTPAPTPQKLRANIPGRQ